MKIGLYRVRDAEELQSFFSRSKVGKHTSIAFRKSEAPGLKNNQKVILLADKIDMDALEDWTAEPEQGVSMVGAGIVRSSGRVSSTQNRFTFHPIFLFDSPVNLEELRQKSTLGGRQKDILMSGLSGREFPESTSDRIYRALLELLSPQDQDRIKEAFNSRRRYIPASSAEALVLQQERDAIILSTDIFGGLEGVRGLMRQMDPQPSTAPFLSRINGSHQLEDTVINKDARNFLTWTGHETEHAAVMTFSNGQGELTVVNVNKTALEETTGADLIYFNHQYSSFVLVQYKMMKKEANSWAYRPDRQFYLERDRLTKIEEAHNKTAFNPTDHLSYRLASPATYFKFCRKDAQFSTDDANLMHGNYVPTEFVEPLMVSMQGPRGGLRLEHEVLGSRSMYNREFAALVSAGLIGTRGTTTDALNDVIEMSLASGHSVIFAVETETAVDEF